MAVKNAVAKNWAAWVASADGKKWSEYPAGDKSVAETGLIFPSNNVAGSDIGIDFLGADMVPRLDHTIIWKANYTDQAGYYAWCWHVFADNAWHGGSGAYGCHPYPTTGAHDGSGYSTGGTGSSGTTHYHEIANGLDKISDGGSGLVLQKGVWLWQARTCQTVGSNYVHTYWPDIQNNPGFSITWITSTAPNTASFGALKFRFGASPWTATGSANEETPSGIFRHLLQYSRAMSLSEIQAKLALTSNDTTDVDRWYSNINPTPSDISDKSGKGHHPVWANANRPTLWSS